MYDRLRDFLKYTYTMTGIVKANNAARTKLHNVMLYSTNRANLTCVKIILLVSGDRNRYRCEASTVDFKS